MQVDMESHRRKIRVNDIRRNPEFKTHQSTGNVAAIIITSAKVQDWVDSHIGISYW